MCVLPVLGYKPITSYFSRVPSANRKRKETSEIVSDAKRQRPSLPSASGGPPKRHAEEEIPEGDRDIDYDYPSTEVVGLPLTPLPRLPRRTKGVTLPTPPTSAAPSRKAVGKDGSTPSDRLGLSNLRAIDPTIPSTPTFLQPETRSLAVDATLLDLVDGPTVATGNYTIPPSQRQTVDELEDFHLASVSTRSSGDDHKFARKPIPDSNLIIESSQSQYLVLESPRKREKEQRIWSSFPAVDPIPSSQSQEEELVIPCKFRGECLGSQNNTSFPMSKMGYSSAPRRTVSEELFPVPIQDSILRDIFPVEKVEGPPFLNAPVPATRLHESVIEPETEEESELDANAITHYGSPPQFAVTRDSSFSQSSHGPGSYSSLPLAVWEFKEMFGNGDESYPADFPESLRS